ncbi:Uma2 family endonuclease [Phormidesmis sp. 146-12]
MFSLKPMIAQLKHSAISPEEYLAGEEKSQIRHEYFDGQVYAMSGGSDSHNTIAGNLFTQMRSHVRGGRCRVFMENMKAYIPPLNCYYYPDVMVTCDDRDRSSSHSKSYPCLIVEVLSDSTEAFDRGDKFAAYRHLDSLQEYVLISQKRQQVECFRRSEAGVWVFYSYDQKESIQLASLDFQISMEALYEDVDFAVSDAANNGSPSQISDD